MKPFSTLVNVLTAAVSACTAAPSVQPQRADVQVGISETTDSIDPTAFTAQDPKAGFVFIERTDNGSCSATVSIDGTPVANLNASQSITRFVPPGDHTIGAKGCNGAPATMAVTVRTNSQNDLQLTNGKSGLFFENA